MKKKLVTDVIWNVLALVIFNGILQCIVYPWLNRDLGADKFGEILYVLAIISVFAPAVGLANNNTRIVEDRDRETYNGDFVISMFTQIFFFGGFLCGYNFSSLREFVRQVSEHTHSNCNVL